MSATRAMSRRQTLFVASAIAAASIFGWVAATAATAEPPTAVTTLHDGESLTKAAAKSADDDDVASLPADSPFIGTILFAAPEGSAASTEDIATRNVKSIFGALEPGTVTMLASYTNSDYGEIQGDGSVIPAYSDTLVWAFLSTGQYEGNSGGAIGENGQPVTPKGIPLGTTCYGVILADATTGDYLAALSSCPVVD